MKIDLKELISLVMKMLEFPVCEEILSEKILFQT
jgi:hypothetical protein